MDGKAYPTNMNRYFANAFFTIFHTIFPLKTDRFKTNQHGHTANNAYEKQRYHTAQNQNYF
jgi:hypothetical protein